MDKWTAVVLAAGKGTRMKSRLPKVLHPLAGWPMVRYVVEAVREAGVLRVLVVIGHEAMLVREALGDGVEYVEQPVQLGTGHAVLQTRGALQGWTGNLLVLCGDTPLITGETLASLLTHHYSTRALVTLLTGRGGYREGAGRIMRRDDGSITGIVEEREASASQRDISEWNTGVYCLTAPWLWDMLGHLPVHDNGEYYLTDLIGAAVSAGERVESLTVTDSGECLGINSRVELARAEGSIRQRIRERLMLSGVTLKDPASTFIDNPVRIGPDCTIHPNTYLLGRTSLGSDCVIGPNSQIIDSVIGDDCRVLSSVIEDAVLERGIDVGPFSHVRPATYLEEGVHIGNFVEIKASRLGRGSKVGHFSYVGDAQVGRDVNIGAGTITANYDGRRKNRTVVDDGAFIGSDSTLVAPVHVGAGAVTGAGSVVTRDIPAGAVAYGVPARPRDRKVKRGEQKDGG